MPLILRMIMEPISQTACDFNCFRTTYRAIGSPIVNFALAVFILIKNLFNVCMTSFSESLAGRAVFGSLAPSPQASSGIVVFHINDATQVQMKAFFTQAERIMLRIRFDDVGELRKTLIDELASYVADIRSNLEMPDAFMKLILISKAAHRLGAIQVRNDAHLLVIEKFFTIANSVDTPAIKIQKLQGLILWVSDITQDVTCDFQTYCITRLSAVLHPLFQAELTTIAPPVFIIPETVSGYVQFVRPSFSTVRTIIESARLVESGDTVVHRKAVDYVRTVVEVFPGIFLGGAYPAETSHFGISNSRYSNTSYRGGYRAVRKFNGTVTDVPQKIDGTNNDPLNFGAIIRCAYNCGGIGFEFMQSVNDFSIGLAMGRGPTAEVNQETLLDPGFHKAIKQAIMLILQSLLSDLPVLVHCRHGSDRSAAVAALTVALICNITLPQAAESNGCRRPDSNPYTGTYGLIMEQLWLPILQADDEIQALITQLQIHLG